MDYNRAGTEYFVRAGTRRFPVVRARAEDRPNDQDIMNCLFGPDIRLPIHHRNMVVSHALLGSIEEQYSQ